MRGLEHLSSLCATTEAEEIFTLPGCAREPHGSFLHVPQPASPREHHHVPDPAAPRLSLSGMRAPLGPPTPHWPKEGALCAERYLLPAWTAHGWLRKALVLSSEASKVPDLDREDSRSLWSPTLQTLARLHSRTYPVHDGKESQGAIGHPSNQHALIGQQGQSSDRHGPCLCHLSTAPSFGAQEGRPGDRSHSASCPSVHHSQAAYRT